MNAGKKEYIFTWFIENYSHCWHKTGEPLVSPEFTADGLEGTVWYIELFPRGCNHKYVGNISIFLGRREDDGPEDFSVTHTLSFLQSNGGNLKVYSWPSTFRKGSREGWRGFIMRKEVLSQRKAEYLPQDILSVRCRLMRCEGSVQKVSHIFARTRIAIEQISFLHITDNFSTIESNQKKTIHIRSPSKKAFALSSNLSLTDGSCCEEKIIMEITPFDASQIDLSECKLYLIEESGRIIECGAADNRFDDTRKDIKKVLLSLTREFILQRKSECLTDDKLSLLCKCIFSTGLESEMMGNTLDETAVVPINQISKNYQDKDICNDTEKRLAYPSALDDLKVVYNDQLLTDVELKTKTKSFSAHKIVLCARSSVFKAMLTNDMKEKNTNCIQVDDLDDDTVQQLLLFLYSDSFENMGWDSAIKLYYAADKYEVEKLKALCSSYLLDNLNASNAGELLLLADTHNDSNLKKVAEDFIYQHQKLVYGSDEWKNLIKRNPTLVSKTMVEIYNRKI